MRTSPNRIYLALTATAVARADPGDFIRSDHRAPRAQVRPLPVHLRRLREKAQWFVSSFASGSGLGSGAEQLCAKLGRSRAGYYLEAAGMGRSGGHTDVRYCATGAFRRFSAVHADPHNHMELWQLQRL